MRISKHDVPIKVETEGATARQQRDFGDATGYGPIGAEHFAMAAGVDIAPLLQGLENDLCQAPHWGHMLQGAVTVTYGDGSEEKVTAGDLFYWPPGHTVRVDEAAEFVLFSPQHEHTPVFDHLNEKLGGG